VIRNAKDFDSLHYLFLRQEKNISQTEKKYFPDKGENNGRLIVFKNV